MNRTMNISLCTVMLPISGSVKGATAFDEDKPDEFLIFIDENQDENHQAAAFLHEMLHIYHDDFASHSTSPYEIESARRAELRELLQMLVDEDL